MKSYELQKRYLVWHPESGSLFEVLTPASWDDVNGDGLCEDVTGIPAYEEQYLREKAEAKQGGTE